MEGVLGERMNCLLEICACVFRASVFTLPACTSVWVHVFRGNLLPLCVCLSIFSRRFFKKKNCMDSGDIHMKENKQREVVS